MGISQSPLVRKGIWFLLVDGFLRVSVRVGFALCSAFLKTLVVFHLKASTRIENGKQEMLFTYLFYLEFVYALQQRYPEVD